MLPTAKISAVYDGMGPNKDLSCRTSLRPNYGQIFVGGPKNGLELFTQVLFPLRFPTKKYLQGLNIVFLIALQKKMRKVN
jgi:hypothetical protein